MGYYNESNSGVRPANVFSLENLHINMCMQIHMLFCYGFSFLLHYGLPRRSETVSVVRGYGRTGGGRREQGKINPNIAYFALSGSSSVRQRC